MEVPNFFWVGYWYPRSGCLIYPGRLIIKLFASSTIYRTSCHISSHNSHQNPKQSEIYIYIYLYLAHSNRDQSGKKETMQLLSWKGKAELLPMSQPRCKIQETFTKGWTKQMRSTITIYPRQRKDTDGQGITAMCNPKPPPGQDSAVPWAGVPENTQTPHAPGSHMQAPMTGRLVVSFLFKTGI